MKEESKNLIPKEILIKMMSSKKFNWKDGELQRKKDSKKAERK